MNVKIIVMIIIICDFYSLGKLVVILPDKMDKLLTLMPAKLHGPLLKIQWFMKAFYSCFRWNVYNLTLSFHFINATKHAESVNILTLDMKKQSKTPNRLTNTILSLDVNFFKEINHIFQFWYSWLNCKWYCRINTVLWVSYGPQASKIFSAQSLIYLSCSVLFIGSSKHGLFFLSPGL